MRRRIMIVLASAIIGLVTSLVATTPAQASSSDCYISPRVCMWDNPGYLGLPTYYWTISSGTGGYCVNIGSPHNDTMKAIKITGGRSATPYEHSNCTGHPITFVGMPPSGPQRTNCWYGDWWGACVTGTEAASSIWIIR